MEMTVIALDSGIKRINLAGRLDIVGAGEIENQFAFQTVTQKNAVVVDMSEVEFIASIGMRLLLGNAKAAAKRGGKIVLFNPTPLVREALEAAGIDQLMAVYDDFDAACADVQAAVLE